MIKFLLDAQLPKKISLFLDWKGYDSLHTIDLPLQNKTTDNEINKISIDEKRVVVTKDLDFIESFLVSNKPYKLIYISTGNIPNKKLLKIFSENIELIIKYIEENSFIEITQNNIIIRK